MPARPTRKLEGGLIGAAAGLLAVWYILSSAIDPHVTEHKDIYPAALAFVGTFALVCFVVTTLIGCAIGNAIKRTADASKDHHITPSPLVGEGGQRPDEG